MPILSGCELLKVSDWCLVLAADSVFGVPAAHLLEIGLPYSLQHI
jgi:hypothetical protein